MKDGEKTLHQRLMELNEKVTQRTPGYYVQNGSNSGPFRWEIVAPDGSIRYERERFEAIESVALRFNPTGA